MGRLDRPGKTHVYLETKDKLQAYQRCQTVETVDSIWTSIYWFTDVACGDALVLFQYSYLEFSVPTCVYSAFTYSIKTLKAIIHNRKENMLDWVIIVRNHKNFVDLANQYSWAI